MPYILKDDRGKFDQDIHEFINLLLDAYKSYNTEVQQGILERSKNLAELFRSIGDVNYVLSVILWKYFDFKPSYSRLNEITDALNGLYDRLYLGTSHIPSKLEMILLPLLQEAIRRFSGGRGVIRDIEHEFRRRRGDIYEDGKIANPENGDIL